MKKIKKNSQLRGYRRLMLEPLERRELLSVSPFWDIQRTSWNGATTDHFCGNTLINQSETLNNSGLLTYDTATLPANTGVPAYSDAWMTGDYWWGMGVMDRGSDGATINNTGTIESTVSGSGPAQAVGIGSIQQFTINNWGTIAGTTQNYLGDAEGVWTESSGTTLVNHAGATIIATSDFLARAVHTQNAVNLVNDGTIEAVCGAGGTVGNVTNRARAACIDTGSDSSPMYYENNGTLIARATSPTTQNEVNCFGCNRRRALPRIAHAAYING